jgi:hypothetical protein
LVKILKKCSNPSNLSSLDWQLLVPNIISDQEEPFRLRILSRLAYLLSASVRAASATPQSYRNLNKRPQTTSQHNVSVDALAYLISCGVAEQLVVALENIRLNDKKISSTALNALMEPIEMISRPQMYKHMENWESAHAKKSSKGEQMQLTGDAENGSTGELLSQNSRFQNELVTFENDHAAMASSDNMEHDNENHTVGQVGLILTQY